MTLTRLIQSVKALFMRNSHARAPQTVSKAGHETPAPAEKAKGQTQRPSRSFNLAHRVSDYLGGRYLFRYNVLTEQTECADLSADDIHYEKVDRRMLNTISIKALEDGLDCWDRDIQRFVNSKKVEAYHPFTAYMDALPRWDGRDRVAGLGASVSHSTVWQQAFHRWMLAMTAQWMHMDMNGRANSVAPLLVSARQGWGKSTFCRQLMPDPLKPYFSESFSLASPAAAEQKLALCGLINIDEYDKIGAKKQPLLKNLMQMTALNIRKAYHRTEEPLHRIASFIGTSNREDLLTDRTGSRRFICVRLERPITGNAPDHAQLYAQLKAELEAGGRYWFTKDEEEAIQRNNALFYRHIPEEEVFRAVFRFAAADDDPAGILQLNVAQIYTAMKRHQPAAMRGMTPYTLSRILPQLGERRHTMNGNVYRVVKVA